MKTKNILTTVVTVAVLIASAFTGLAQSKSLPIDSVGRAVSHNLVLIRQVYGQVWADSLLNTNGSRTFWNQAYNPNNVPKAADLVSIVATNPFAFLIARPTNDWVSTWVSYDSADGDQLFYADVGFQLVQSNGLWQVPASASTNLQNYIGYYEPLYETNAVGAHLNLRDANENLLQTVYLEVYQVGPNNNVHVGKILNQTQYLGQHGELVVTYGQYDQYGNETNSYDMAFALDEDKGGTVITPALVKASFTPTWDGLIAMLTPPIVNLTNVQSVNHIGSSPIVQITLTNTMTVYFSASTVEGENANGFGIKWLQPGADYPYVPYTIPAGSTSLGVQLPAGTYHIDYTWPLLAPVQINPWWYYGSVTAVSQKGG